MRFLHTMLCVGDMQRGINFYTQVLRTTERLEQKYSLAFVGFGSNPEHAEIELTHNHGVDSYELGAAYGHIALGVPDMAATCEAGPVKGCSSIIAFITDPDGYKIELIERF